MILIFGLEEYTNKEGKKKWKVEALSLVIIIAIFNESGSKKSKTYLCLTDSGTFRT